jgi:hypothetical protein
VTTTQTLLWTAIPNGVVTNGGRQSLRLSVIVTVRLWTDEGTTLAQFPDLLDWPTRMQHGQLGFTLQTDNGVHVDAPIVSDPPDPALWEALFTSEIPVHPHSFDDLSNRPIVSWPVLDVLSHLKSCYQTVAMASPSDLPLIRRPEAHDEERGALADVFDPLVQLHLDPLNVQTDAQLSARLDASIESARVIARRRRATGQPGLDEVIQPSGIGPSGSPMDAYYRTMLFHYRPAAAQPAELPDGEAATARFEEEFDFHQILSALGDYPQLLRHLGLIFDLEVPAEALPQTPDEATPRKVRALPTWTSALPSRQRPPVPPWTYDYSPWTVYRYAQMGGRAWFMPASSSGEVQAGLWTPSAAQLVQVDVDGAALKAINMAGSIARTSPSSSSAHAIDAPSRAGVPALRTCGISLVRTGHARQLNATFNKSARLDALLNTEPPQPADLHAEDLVRGYRLDVHEDRTSQWRSLHQRVGAYTTRAAVLQIADEGFTQVNVTSRTEDPATPPDPGAELYAHESLFTWDGWSLSAPRPGKSISRSPRAPSADDPDTAPQRVENTAMTRLGLSTSFRVQPASLPRLRFGQAYQLRVRVCDLAGNSPTLDEATDTLTALPKLAAAMPLDDPLIYLRFDPIAPPELIPRTLYNATGAPDAADAVAFTEGESLQRLVIRSNINRSAQDYAAGTPYEAFAERHVAAPKAALALIEAHGLLDEALDAKTSGLAPADVQAAVEKIYSVAARESGSFDDPTPAVRFIRTGTDPVSTAGFSVHTEEQLVLPYLPDPWATGVAFLGLPGTAGGELFTVPFGGGEWHEATPFRLRLVEGSDQPNWDPVARVLTVALPQTAEVNVRVSSLFGGDLEVVGLWRWLLEAAEAGKATGDQVEELRRAILESRHWMVTPFRQLMLVHAVQQPLMQPSPRLSVTRFIASTSVELHGEILLHAGSTSKLDIVAQWTEPKDDPANDAPDFAVSSQAHVLELPTWLDGATVKVDDTGETADALWLRDDNLLVFDTAQASSAQSRLRKALASQPPPSPNEQRRIQDQLTLAGKVTAHEFGDTKFRSVTYQVSATSRFREYFSFPVTDDPANLRLDSEAITVDILSSARPTALRVLYALPTFGWEQSTDLAGVSTSVRRGGGIRIYLDRPWWSSGAGELLAVILGQTVPDPKDPLYQFSTVWGQDPIRTSPGLRLPDASSFPSAVQIVHDVTLPEVPGARVTIVGFEVHWDGHRGRWYCDLDLNTAGAWYPFIRLALARYQPHSLEDVALSPVVLADFVQTAPDRVVTLVRNSGGAGIHHVSVTGVTYSAQRALDNTFTAATSRVEALVQQHLTNRPDDALAWRDLPLTFGLTAGQPDPQGNVTWQGEVSIPPDAQAADLRLLIQEFEELSAPTEAPAGATSRLVFMDTIQL